MDFGLVKEVERGGDASLTTAGTLTGTPLYMAPEAITAPETLDARSDLYSLGAVGYYLLVGADVFTGRSVVEVCGHHLHSEPVPPSERAEARVPPDLEAVLLSCLAKAPAERPDGAERPATATEGLRTPSGAGPTRRPASGGAGTPRTSPRAGERPRPA